MKYPFEHITCIACTAKLRRKLSLHYVVTAIYRTGLLF